VNNIKLALDGTSSLFPLHVGGYKYLEDYNIKIQEIIATSGGSIVGGMIASGYNFESMKTILNELDFANILDFDWNPYTLWSRRGIYKGNRILKELKRYIPYTFKELALPLTVVVSELNSRQGLYYNKENSPNMYVADAIRKSISIPLFFQAVKENGNLFVDGGVHNNFGVDYFGTIANNVVGFKTVSIHHEGREIKSFKDYLLAIVQVMVESNEREHIEDALFAKVILLPSNHNRLDFNLTPEVCKNMIDSGYQAVKRFFDNL
jgi:NTE family protein